MSGTAERIPVGVHRPLEEGMRRTLNCLLAMVGCILGLPFWGLVALAIKMEDGEPAFFVQTRLGQDGKPFRLIKFRTMSPEAEVLKGIDWRDTDVPQAEHGKITRVGGFLRRFRLDELPQLLNVVKGDIHLVGPRPERPQAAGARAKLIPGYERRLQVKPGITGWAQIHYPYRDAAEKFEYDLYYIQHRSLWLDLVILLRTVFPVLGGRGR